MSEQEKTFKGFQPSNTTPVPDIFFDELLPDLSNAELRVLLYIFRRTWGFKKDTDAISFNQFLKGITTKDGRVLDRGCGVTSRGALSKALKSLEERGCITTKKGKDPLGDNQTTLYSIRFVSNAVVNEPQEGGAKNELPVVPKSNHRSSKNVPPVVLKMNQQETEGQETGKQQTDNKRGNSTHHPQTNKPATNPPTSNNLFNEKVEQFRSTFIALGKEYFAYEKFTTNRVQPNSEVYTRILEIIGDGEPDPQAMRTAFLKLWNHKDRDGTYWWQDKSKLTLKAYVNNYDDQDTKQPANDTTASNDPLVDLFNQRCDARQARKRREGFITDGPLAGQPDFDADPWT